MDIYHPLNNKKGLYFDIATYGKASEQESTGHYCLLHKNYKSAAFFRSQSSTDLKRDLKHSRLSYYVESGLEWLNIHLCRICHEPAAIDSMICDNQYCIAISEIRSGLKKNSNNRVIFNREALEVISSAYSTRDPELIRAALLAGLVGHVSRNGINKIGTRLISRGKGQ